MAILQFCFFWIIIYTSLIQEINPEYSQEGRMLKLQYFSHVMQRADSLEKTLMLEKTDAGGEGDDRG